MSTFTFRAWSGLALIIAGLLLLPAAWAFSRTLWLASFSLIAAGLWLFETYRIRRRSVRHEQETGGKSSVGRDTPTDIHNYTGWKQGGRSETMDASSEAADVDSE